MSQRHTRQASSLLGIFLASLVQFYLAAALCNEPILTSGTSGAQVRCLLIDQMLNQGEGLQGSLGKQAERLKTTQLNVHRPQHTHTPSLSHSPCHTRPGAGTRELHGIVPATQEVPDDGLCEALNTSRVLWNEPRARIQEMGFQVNLGLPDN